MGEIVESAKYTIGETKYFQRELVLGQWEQLLKVLDGIAITGRGLNDILQEVSDKGRMGRLLAILLIPEGTAIRDKNIDELTQELLFSVTSTTASEVLNDFFDCNPVSSIAGRLGRLAVRMIETLTAHLPPIGQADASSPSAGETSPAGMPSDGDAPQEKPTTGSSTSNEKSSTGNP